MPAVENEHAYGFGYLTQILVVVVVSFRRSYIANFRLVAVGVVLIAQISFVVVRSGIVEN